MRLGELKMDIWEILHIEPTNDRKAIRKAYAARTKVIHPEEKPEEFKLLHEAYQAALQYAEFEAKRKVDFGQYDRDADVEYSGSSDNDSMEPTMVNSSSEPENVDNPELISYFTESQEKQKNRIDTFLRYWEECKSPYQNPEASAQWQEYLSSEDFQDIRWNAQIMHVISEEIDDKLLYGRMELKMLFWKAYGFREDDELEYQGEQLKLRRCLYQAYEYYKRLDLAKHDTKIWGVSACVALAVILVIGIISFRYSRNKMQNERTLIEQYMSDEYPGIEITEPEKDKQNSGIVYTFHSSSHPEFLITAEIQYFYDYRNKQNIAQVTEEDYGLQLMEYYAAKYGVECGRLEYEDEVYSVLFYSDIEQVDDFCGVLKRMFDEEEELKTIQSVGICERTVLYPEVLVLGGLSQFPFTEMQIYDPHTIGETELSSQIQEAYMIYMFQYESWNLTARQYEKWGGAYEKICEQWKDGDGAWYDMRDPDTGEFLCRLYIPTYKYVDDHYEFDGYSVPSYKRAITVGNAYYFMLEREANVTVNEDGSGFTVEFYGETKTFGEKPEVEFNELRKWY